MSDSDITGRPHENVGEAARVEALPGRERVRRVLPDDLRPQRNQPVERLVERVEEHPLEPFVTAGALAPEVLEGSVAPDDTAREEHRAARPVALLQHDWVGAELAGARGCAEAGHPGAGYEHYVREKLGLCSTYSILTRSGPQTKSA